MQAGADRLKAQLRLRGRVILNCVVQAGPSHTSQRVFAGNPARLKATPVPLVPYDLAPMAVKSLLSFPMTPTGKIAKAELRERALAEGKP